MFASELRAALERKDRNAICRLLESIPANCWQYPGNPPYAQTRYDSVIIVVHSGGGGINTYETVSVSVQWHDGKLDFAGQYSAGELRLPKCIPPSERARTEKKRTWADR